MPLGYDLQDIINNIKTSGNIYDKTTQDNKIQKNLSLSVIKQRVPMFLKANTSISYYGFSTDGLYLYTDLSTVTVKHIHQYTMSVPWDLNSLTFDSSFYDTTIPRTLTRGMNIDPSGNKFYLTTSTEIIQYNLGTPFDITTAVYDSSINTIDDTSGITNYRTTIAGNYMYQMLQSKNIAVYSFPTDDIQDASLLYLFDYTTHLDKGFLNTIYAQMLISPDGTYFYTGGTIYNRFYLETPWDLNTVQPAKYTFVSRGLHGAKFSQNGKQDMIFGNAGFSLIKYKYKII